MTSILKAVFIIGFGLLTLNVARGDVIDFEGFAGDGVALSNPVVTATNSVTFQVGTVTPTGPAYLAGVGSPPMTAFVVNPGQNDVPFGQPDNTVFLTDEPNGPHATLDYFLSFENPISELSLDLFDYRVDGGPTRGATATLTVFETVDFMNPLGSAMFTIPNNNPVDGNVVNLAVSLANGSAQSATVVFSEPDVGTGIDNINFTTVTVTPTETPEPTSLTLFSLTMLGAGACYRLRKRRNESCPG